MGQRLVVTVETDNKKLCCIYFHWDGYTGNALDDTKKIIDCIYNHKAETESELLLRLIRFCENNGGGIRGDDAEFEYIQDLYPNEIFKTENYSRNDGLIALSKDGMTSLESWSEADVFINIDTDQVDFCVYSGYDNIEEYIEERKSWNDEFDESELSNIPTFDFDLGYFNINDIDEIIKGLDVVDYEGVVKCGDEICELIY